jgi:hypothetical protein
MPQRLTPWLLLLLGCALTPLGAGQLPQEQQQETRYPFELTADEIRQARVLAENGPGLSHGKTVFVKIELLPDAQAETTQRQVMVTHYRYENDETLYTFVDLKLNTVMKVEIQLHAPTALAAEEKVLVEKLARAEAQLAGVFATHGARLRVEMRPTQPASEQSPLFGHRLALLHFGVGDGYLRDPEVIVDLTTEQVHITQPQSQR